MSWSAHQYSQFETERNRPVVDLLSHLPEAGVNRAVDIGCGSGNSTGLLRQRYPQASIYGIDSSADMIAAARRRLPAIDFQAIDIDEWRPDVPSDLILANAVIVGTDHGFRCERPSFAWRGSLNGQYGPGQFALACLTLFSQPPPVGVIMTA
ncbi:methyltransferase domain-containing protein [Salinisphaera sp. SWV1]|uniref:methyltransferase domain-containing protein n=1 Tax=Salinisphaera sp. SWV1 TaxID=3454139 RepID=UPI003F873C23